jgi:hypothetical protein
MNAKQRVWAKYYATNRERLNAAARKRYRAKLGGYTKTELKKIAY